MTEKSKLDEFGVEVNLDYRWEKNTPHHEKSIALYSQIAEIDEKYNDDAFNWKSGGDGDNGEELMYLLDIIFEREDKETLEKVGQKANIYQVWKDEDTLILSLEKNIQEQMNKGLIGKDAVLAVSFTAYSFLEALATYHKFMSFKSFKSMPEVTEREDK